MLPFITIVKHRFCVWWKNARKCSINLRDLRGNNVKFLNDNNANISISPLLNDNNANISISPLLSQYDCLTSVIYTGKILSHCSLVTPVSTLVQMRDCCLPTPSHYLNQCWILISEALRHLPDSNFSASAIATILHGNYWNYTFKNYCHISQGPMT